MHRPTVVALVVVLGDHLPIGGNVVTDPATDDQLVEGKPRHPIGARAQLVEQGRPIDGEPDEGESAPFGERETMQ